MWAFLSIFILFSGRTPGSISTKLKAKYPWVKGIQVCSNEEPHPFHGNEIAKIHWQNWRIFLSRTTGPISTKLGTKHPWVKGIHDFTNKKTLKYWSDNVFSLLMLWYNHIFAKNQIVFINWNCFSGERCGQWTFKKRVQVSCMIVRN